LSAGDIERELFGIYTSDNMLDTLDSMTIYMSKTDRALQASKTIRSYPRLGQPWEEGELSPEAIDFIKNNPKINFVNVTGVEEVNKGDGHEYYRNSPWVSSDIIANLGLGMSPEERGLVRMDDKVYWSFPDDYIEDLQQNQEQINSQKEDTP